VTAGCGNRPGGVRIQASAQKEDRLTAHGAWLMAALSHAPRVRVPDVLVSLKLDANRQAIREDPFRQLPGVLHAVDG
jgi:hypothetical protein